MNNLECSPTLTFSQDSTKAVFRKRVLLLCQFFLIILVYHTLKDLKDTLVITASDAGAEVIPFIKIWGMLPISIFASYLFSKVYSKMGREKTMYFFVSLLLGFYLFFAFFLYPLRESLHLTGFGEQLQSVLPPGCKGFVSMICHWIYTAFYLTAELWSMLILSILFWGYVNQVSSIKDAKQFYPLCMIVGNCAGIVSGQTSCYLCRHLMDYLSWQQTLQLMVLLVTFCGIGIMWINRELSRSMNTPATTPSKNKQEREKISFKDSLMCISRSPLLICIALLVVGFGLTSNLIEVIWKESIKKVHPGPQEYNAYINQLTSIIGACAVIASILSRWVFRVFSWTTVALITPVILLLTSSVFFLSFQLSPGQMEFISSYIGLNPLYLIMTVGSCYCVMAMTAKYTVFDMTKEMAFLSLESSERIKAKSIIDTMGSRIGKSGAAGIYQFLLIFFGSTAGQTPFIGIIATLVIGASVVAVKKIGGTLSSNEDYETAKAIL